MAQQTASVNINQLPRVQEINNNDLIILSNPNGTYTIPFSNFVLGPENTTFGPLISANTNDIISLSADLDTKINELSATVDAEYDKFYVGKATFNINGSNTQSIMLSPVLPVGVTPTKADIILCGGNNTAVLSGAYVSDVTIMGDACQVTVTSPYTYSSLAVFYATAYIPY